MRTHTTGQTHSFTLTETLVLGLILTVLAVSTVPRMVAAAVDAKVSQCSATVVPLDEQGESCSVRTGTLLSLQAAPAEGEATCLPERLSTLRSRRGAAASVPQATLPARPDQTRVPWWRELSGYPKSTEGATL